MLNACATAFLAAVRVSALFPENVSTVSKVNTPLLYVTVTPLIPACCIIELATPCIPDITIV